MSKGYKNGAILRHTTASWRLVTFARFYSDEMSRSFLIVNRRDSEKEKSEWLKLEILDKENSKYRLTLNALHLFFYPFIQKKDFLVVLAKFAAALVIAELNSYEVAQGGLISPSSIRIAMGQVLEDFTDER